VHRIVGAAHDGTRRCSWSLIHKAVRSPAGVTMPNGEAVPRDLPDGPAFFGYWRREPEAYGAGVLQDLPGGMAAPRCFGVSARPDGTIWLWLEEVGEGHQRSGRLSAARVRPASWVGSTVRTCRDDRCPSMRVWARGGCVPG
jgi:hypothetical protein